MFNLHEYLYLVLGSLLGYNLISPSSRFSTV